VIKVAVAGATGYTGQELVKLLVGHPEVHIQALLCHSHEGQTYSDLFPQFIGEVDLPLLHHSAINQVVHQCDVLFLALPHGAAASLVDEELLSAVKVIDLGSDFRLKQASLYDKWYEMAHPGPHLLNSAVYGLPEWNRVAIKKANLVANPGCYATTVLLSLMPLMLAGASLTDTVIVDAKSGVSGAGRALSLPVHYNECNESVKAYKVASHRHTPEIEQELAQMAQKEVKLLFTPHLVPMSRGILSTAYVTLNNGASVGQLKKLYEDQYKNEPFVKVLSSESPETNRVSGTNNCHISINFDERTGSAVIIGALDNLVKGAAGQAVQNMNLVCGLPETSGLVRRQMLTPA
jgi:N-acetyl-gamma-glutamyl-phosphate reductase